MKLGKHVRSQTSGLFLLFIALFFVQEAFPQCIIDVDFNRSNRRYSIQEGFNDFNNQLKPWTASKYRGIEAPGGNSSLHQDTPQETRIVNNTLRAHYKDGLVGAVRGGFAFDAYFDGVEEAYLEYRVKFEAGFKFEGGGKLPGLGGSINGAGSEVGGNGSIPSGGVYNDNGFSARLMWRRSTDGGDLSKPAVGDPRLILYSYFYERKDQTARTNNTSSNKGPKPFGDDYYVGPDDSYLTNNPKTPLQTNKWYTIKQYIKLNTPGVRDGIVRIWIDGVLTFEEEDLKIRKSGKGNLKINSLIMNTYRGGGQDRFWESPGNTDYAFFDDFKVWTGVSTPSCNGGGGSNQAPTVSFTTPANNATFNVGDDIVVNVAASDSDGSVDNVKLYLNNNFVRQENVAPYDWGHQAGLDPALENMSAGTYVLKAVAEDDDGDTTTEEITITVGNPNNPPTLSFTTPSNGASYDEGDDVVVNVAASDSDGSIANVKLYLDGSFVRQENVAPYDWGHQAGLDPALENMSAGTYILEVIAEDNEGATSSTQITITVEGGIEGVYFFKNVATGTYMDSDGGNIKVGNSTSGADKRWSIVQSAGNQYNIDSEFNGRGVIEALNNGVINGTSVQPVSTTNRREWTVESLPGNKYRFKNVDKNAYLAANTSNNEVEWTTWDGNRAQWTLEPVSGSMIEDQDGDVEITKINYAHEVYPNPAGDHFFVNLEQKEEAEVWIYNLDGRLLQQQIITQGLNRIERDKSWMSGMYLVKIVSAGETVATQKVLFE